ncbi:gamma-glutamylcyclotransferase family protein [Salinisphaera sp. Q1T1-3]|uniref:gamma-glutamylcyclotransferase family protein n=1 Tax=Salinisphaera sp. Q1T1-3 TaxID=2321229 RepID=UPI000E73A0F4|nr:gamma-glutamylcyclotransferase family protein [Salinisphaera sp. Q1T1-3]RJS92857.1 gamma-glutamylcyclotransferase [Salinisphaera sp. Q1T1-3]
MYYFAYGSNMCTARLARRVPSVRPLGAASLAGHRLAWHLIGSDASGKCNVVATGEPGDVVHGVVFELEADRLEALHAAEGPAYDFLELPVVHAGKTLTAAIYRGRADWLDDARVPYAWYRDFVLAGAREHALPQDWIAGLDRVSTVTDPDAERTARNREILAEIPINRLD